ncbi:MAG: LLM class flavin-dependent oxidoreductase [Solimonas sp.]
MSRQIRLGAFLPANGHHVAAWRHPDVPADAGHDFAHYKRIAQAAERAKFDAVFLADNTAVIGGGERKEVLSRTAAAGFFEPLTLLSGLAAVTERIGLIATVTTTYNEPYNVARKFASLDHLSGGRSGWNLVTSADPTEASNFGVDAHAAHAVRYERAEEFIDVVSGLWDSWEDDALVNDKRGGRKFDPDKLHVLDHRGQYYAVRGPLNIARSPQGHPVKVQAGSSEPGKALAARTAEVVFTAQQTLEGAREFYADLKQRLPAFGRHADDVRIMPGIFPVVGRTQAEAQAKYQALQDLIDPVVGLSLLAVLVGDVDLSGYPLDGPVPELPETENWKSRQALVLDAARRNGLTLRQLYLHIAGARGHWQIVGTPVQIADLLEEWFTTGAADGFNIMPPWLPGGLDDFIELVLPELRRRGLFRSEYEGRTLRENLGLPYPRNRYHHHAPAGTETGA